MEDSRPVPKPRRFLSRLGWLVLIWCCSVAALGVVALIMRVLMKFAGMST